MPSITLNEVAGAKPIAYKADEEDTVEGEKKTNREHAITEHKDYADEDNGMTKSMADGSCYNLLGVDNTFV